MSLYHTTAFQPGQESKTPVSKKKSRPWSLCLVDSMEQEVEMYMMFKQSIRDFNDL